MNELLDKQLVEKYPKIFRDRYSNMKVTAMCWGFEHGDGWYNILDALCSNIQHHTDWLRKKRASALKLNRKIKKAIELNSIEPIINHHKGDWELDKKPIEKLVGLSENNKNADKDADDELSKTYPTQLMSLQRVSMKLRSFQRVSMQLRNFRIPLLPLMSLRRDSMKLRASKQVRCR